MTTKHHKIKPGQLIKSLGVLHLTKGKGKNVKLVGERAAQANRNKRVKVTLPPMPWRAND